VASFQFGSEEVFRKEGKQTEKGSAKVVSFLILLNIKKNINNTN
jgi:hypothetical protein